MLTARVSSKGQVVLPKRIRDELELHVGSLFQVAHDGKRIILIPLGKSVPERLYGKYPADSLLEALEIDHAEDLDRETHP